MFFPGLWVDFRGWGLVILVSMVYLQQLVLFLLLQRIQWLDATCFANTFDICSLSVDNKCFGLSDPVDCRVDWWTVNSTLSSTCYNSCSATFTVVFKIFKWSSGGFSLGLLQVWELVLAFCKSCEQYYWGPSNALFLFVCTTYLQNCGFSYKKIVVIYYNCGTSKRLLC